MKHGLTLALIGLICCVTGCSHATLQDAIQSQWKVPVSIELMDTKHRSVIFEDNGQYVFNTYSQNYGKYNYSKTGEDGWTFQSVFLARPVVTKEHEDVIWGVIRSSQAVGRVDVVLTKKRDSGQQFVVHTYVQNDTFVGYPTVHLFDSESDALGTWTIHINAYNDQGDTLLNQDYN